MLITKKKIFYCERTSGSTTGTDESIKTTIPTKTEWKKKFVLKYTCNTLKNSQSLFVCAFEMF